jgi:Universal stress protein family
VIEADTPPKALLGFAHEHGFDLIICGHHTRRAGRLLPHDIADDLYRRARPPVLIVGENSQTQPHSALSARSPRSGRSSSDHAV